MTKALFPIELKQIGEAGEIEGYASTFGNRDLVGDVVQKGAFLRSLKGRPANQIAMLWAHDSKRPIGVWDEVAEDSFGLRVKGRISCPTSSAQRTISPSVRNGIRFPTSGGSKRAS